MAFLDYTKNLFKYVNPFITTQSNESLHNQKSFFAGKDINWRSSFSLRMAFAVMQKNDPYYYYLHLLNHLSLPNLTPKSYSIIEKYFKIFKKKKKKNKLKYLDSEYSMNRNVKRNKHRYKKFSTKDTDHTTKSSEMKITESEIDKLMKKLRPINLEHDTKPNQKKSKIRKEKKEDSFS